ncbi:lactose/L-arabinose transport system substrate-binding protein [Enterococcus sp. PF1-24]|uniref:ABC transporter substrate-binding protein n=1 Tax=unclassified Enterococcus TaxID=2608891 RepID=UPI002473EB69|nr:MULTISPECIES: extracellular solute-binding protein [unclassified Enterococcus]MDH6363429.1 lactose/L-arabinose transport system substrate-binding protein [Enterococcus sp. PFB1-1]MDH6400523.1 lactose/L-arabinose transport system substrate-binding protein [Enterococcus sp. PF1-24]
MEKKKLIKMLGVVACFSVLLAGCGKKAEKADEQDFSQAERVEKAELKVYAPKGKNTDWLNDVAERYNEKYNTEITIKATDVAPPAITQKMTPLLIGNETLPELAYIQDSDITGLLEKFPKSFENISGIGLEADFADSIYPAKIATLKATAPNNDLFGVPQDLGMVMMFYRADIFEEAAVDATELTDWDALIEAGKKIKAATGKNLLALDANGETSLMLYIMQQQDVPIVDKDGNTNMNTEAAKNALKIIDKLKESDVVAYYSSDKDRYTTFQDCAVIIEGTWLAGNMTNNYPEQTGLWRVAPIVGYSSSEQGKNPVSGGSSWYIGANAENKIAALQLMEFAIQDSVSQDDLLNRGSASAVMSSYESEAGQAGYPYFGDQKIYDEVKKAGNNAIELFHYPYAADANSYLKMAVYDYWQKGDMDKSLQTQAEQFAQKYAIEVNN